MKIRLEQFAPGLGRFQENLEFHATCLEQATSDEVSLIVFPELSLTGYLLKDLVPDVALSQTELLTQIRQHTHNVHDLEAVIGFVERTSGYRFYNSAALFAWDSNGHCEIRHVHRKVYLPTYGLFDEGRYYSAGRVVRCCESTVMGRIGILLCEDAWHLSMPMLMAADGPNLEGASALIVLSNSPARGVQNGVEGIPASHQIWDNLLRSYAAMLEVLVVYVNRCGVEDGLCFSGGSQLIAPGGESIKQLGFFSPGRLDAELAWPEVLRSYRVGAPISSGEKTELVFRELKRILGRLDTK